MLAPRRALLALEQLLAQHLFVIRGVGVNYDCSLSVAEAQALEVGQIPKFGIQVF